MPVAAILVESCGTHPTVVICGRPPEAVRERCQGRLLLIRFAHPEGAWHGGRNLAAIHLGDYRGDAPFGAWVRQVAARHCLMHLRSPWQRARRALWPTGADEPDGSLQADAATGLLEPAHEAPLAEHIDLERALARLPETARAVVWLYDVEGLTHEEIAALFRRTISFSKSQLARAHALLRAELVDHRPPVRPAIAEGYAAQGQLP